MLVMVTPETLAKEGGKQNNPKDIANIYFTEYHPSDITKIIQLFLKIDLWRVRCFPGYLAIGTYNY